jgi:hypothetical protein
MKAIMTGAMLLLATTTAWAAQNEDPIQESMPKLAPKIKSNPRSQQPPATEKEKRDAFFAYFSCLDAAAREMDDGRSDASTIALGIKSLCASQFARTVELEGRSLNPAARRLLESKVQDGQLEMATQAVLAGRADRAKTAPFQPTASLDIRPTENGIEAGSPPQKEALSLTPSQDASPCFPSASAVRRNYPEERPSWTLRAPGHEGTRCWYPKKQTAPDTRRKETLQTAEELEVSESR